MWSREITRNLSMKVIQINGLFTTVIGILTQHTFLFLMGVILLAWYFGNEFYLQTVGKKLFFENKKERQYFFIEDTDEIKIILSNQGFLIKGATLRLKISDIVEPLVENHKITTHNYAILPFSIEKEQVTIAIPIAAKKRGLARISSIEISCPSLIGFGEVTLTLHSHVKQECIVYPIAKPVQTIISPISNQMGEVLSKHSLHRDVLSIEGVREYVPTDAFPNVNWKASLRSHQLMTNIYPAVAKEGWHLLLDNTDLDKDEKELYIAGFADICFQLSKKGIPYSLQVNIRTTGETPFLSLPRGEGKEHLQRALELLALISLTALTYPLEEAYQFYQTKMEQQPYVLYAGHQTLKRADYNTTIFHLKVRNSNLAIQSQEVSA
ncbi:DUF58 domain-containing protein [Mangrovibacillus cuniculi]|uniref:DUF58 domain-containing protein n=1 Tax=Mangrovibacillus cuniculi TaxID=2593652 RepID=A0A7S8CEC2_9BACI|nr:DUF58 domain-containing protein [Mangrovibacillus cuniculi]QPC48253.1 DUF58 domain-containing protein [Mangrovibacillus cuniculi]